MNFKILPILCLSVIIFFEARAQKTYTVTFNESGQVTGALPSLVTNKDCIKFVVVGTRESYESRVLTAYTRYLETIKNLDKNDQGVYAVLQQVDLNEPDFKQWLFGVQAKMAQTLLNWIADPAIFQILEKKRNLGEDKTKLTGFTTRPSLPDQTSLVVPDPAKMTIPAYVVQYSYKGLLDPTNLDCVEPLKLDPNEKECLWIFKSKTVGPFRDDLGFFRLDYKLRLRNNLYNTLNDQLKAISWLVTKARAIDIDAQKAIYQADIKLLRAASTINDQLFSWMDSKLNGKEDQTNLPALKLAFDNQPAAGVMIGKLETLDSHLFNTTLKDTATVKLMLLLSWVNKATSLTINPLTNGLPTDIKGLTTAKTDALADSALSLAIVNKKIDLYEAMLKPNTQNCCKTPNYDLQLKSYNAFLTLQKAIIREQAKLTKELADLKEKQSKSDKSQNDYKKSILSDSLLYNGYLNVSLYSDNINHPGYHYMRHHDELNDYRHLDNELQKEINEEQFLEAIADNHDPKLKLLVKYTFADAGADVDFLGAQIPATVAAPVIPSNKLEEIYKVYSRINTLFTPYGNGIIALPLTPIIDETPDFISRTNNAPDPDKVPAKGSYSFLDSLTSKNLNSQSAVFTFRVNKLYRFRLKAGIAYSSLERRSYNINSLANTATYSSSYAGMAPTFGIQVFTTPIDIQQKQAMPVGWHPFFYVGYMFNDAPVNNFLFGGGFEILSGFAITGGVHLGKSQKLFTDQGILQTRDTYKTGWFLSATFGLEAFKAIFNSAKNITNPLIK